MLQEKCEYVFIVSEKILWKSENRMQAEGGFGSRQFDIGCLDSVIEFGPQSSCRRQNNSACTSIQGQTTLSGK
jgi:hypothetical protein